MVPKFQKHLAKMWILSTKHPKNDLLEFLEKQEEPGNPKANQPNSPRHVDPVVFRLKGPKANQDLSCSQLGNQPQNGEQPRLKPDWQPAACALTKHREKGKGTGET